MSDLKLNSEIHHLKARIIDLEKENARLKAEVERLETAHLPQATSDALLAFKNASEAADEYRKRAEVTEARLAEALKALELARAVLAQSITAGHNVPGPTPEDIEKALPERECATEGCCNPSTVHFERGGIGSHYCYDCYLKVQAVATPPTAAGVE